MNGKIPITLEYQIEQCLVGQGVTDAVKLICDLIHERESQAQASLAAAHEDLLVEKSHQQYTAEHVAEIARSAFQVLGALFGTHSPIPRISNWFWDVWQRHEPGELFPLTEEETNCVDKYYAAARAQALEEVGKHCPTYVKAGPGDPHWLEGYGICSCGQAKADGIHPYAEIWREHMRSLTPSDSTALAKLLAEERLDELKRCWTYVHVTEDISDCGLGHGGDIESCDFESCIHFAARVAELKGEQP